MKVLSPSCKNKCLKYRAHWERFCKFQWRWLIFLTSKGIRMGNMPIVSTVVYIAVGKIPSHSRWPGVCVWSQNPYTLPYGFWLRFCLTHSFLAWLNSKLWNTRKRLTFQERQVRSFWVQAYLVSLPFREISFCTEGRSVAPLCPASLLAPFFQWHLFT